MYDSDVMFITLPYFIWRPSEPSGITIVMPPVSSANPEDSDGGAIWFMIGLFVLTFSMLG